VLSDPDSGWGPSAYRQDHPDSDSRLRLEPSDLIVVALAMAVILGNILSGPVLLGQALSAAGGKSRGVPEVLE